HVTVSAIASKVVHARRNRSARRSSGAVAIAESPSITTPTHPGGQSRDPGDTTTFSPRSPNATGAPASVSQSRRASSRRVIRVLLSAYTWSYGGWHGVSADCLRLPVPRRARVRRARRRGRRARPARAVAGGSDLCADGSVGPGAGRQA